MNEPYEIEVSAFVDGELGHPEVLEVVDRLVESPELRVFYRRVRSLDLALERDGVSATDGPLPARLWQQIEGRASATAGRREVVRSRSSLRPPPWMLAAAAVLVVAVGAWLGLRHTPQLAAPAAVDVVRVQVEGDAGKMTDRRFIELTAELLRADRRYQRTMEDILAAVDEHRPEGEGSFEGRDPLSDSGLRRALFTNRDADGERPPRVWD